jgi:uncharacterized protein
MHIMADQYAANLSRKGPVSPPSPWRGPSLIAAFAIILAALATALFCLRPAQPYGAAAAHAAEALARGQEAYRKGDVAEAIAAWRKAAEAGNAAAEKELGLAFKNGRGVAPDYGAALRFLRQAADQGYAPAMIELGEMYERGEGAPRDYATAARWYLEGWQRGGEKWAAYKLSLFYANGLGVAKDEAVANFWNTLASSPAAMCG